MTYSGARLDEGILHDCAETPPQHCVTGDVSTLKVPPTRFLNMQILVLARYIRIWSGINIHLGNQKLLIFLWVTHILYYENFSSVEQFYTVFWWFLIVYNQSTNNIDIILYMFWKALNIWFLWWIDQQYYFGI